MNFLDERLPMRFWDKVIPEPNSGCWLWFANNIAGYGRVWFGGTRAMVPTHRLTYEVCRGAIPAGLEIDHLCRTPECCNPAHLEAVTHSENLRRGTWNERGGWRADLTHCLRGHELVGSNLYVAAKTGKRQCRSCWVIRAARIRARAA